MYDMASFGETTEVLERAIAGDLAQAGAGGADLTVDLAALYRYYNELRSLDAELVRQWQHVTDPNLADSGGYCGAPDGVRLAFEATAEARNGSASLASSIRALIRDLRVHLEALRDNYVGYATRESENIGRLNGATARADKPLGW